MARRAPVDEKPFRPLDVSVLRSVVEHRSESASESVSANPKVIELKEPAARSMVRVDPPAIPQLAPVKPRLDHERRVLFTREETQTLDRLVHELAVRLQTQVKVSHVLRALTSLLLAAENQLDQRAGERGPLTRPPNGDFDALQRFERELAQLLAQALRDAAPTH